MSAILQILLAMIVAALVSGLELITSTYPRTFSFISRCKSFYVYVSVYAGFAFLVMLFIDFLVANKSVTLEGSLIANGWALAVLVGISIKAFLHISLFNVTVGTRSFPIGVESLMRMFEPWLLQQIELFHFNSLRRYIAPKSASHNNLATVKKTVLANIPSRFSEAEKRAFQDDVKKATSVVDVMEMFLIFVGRGTFDRVFP